MSKAKLLQTKQLLDLSKLGYDLLDKKSYLLSRELVEIKTKRKQTEASLQDTSHRLQQVYTDILQDVGIRQVALQARGVSAIGDLKLLKRSIMGVEINTYQRGQGVFSHAKKPPEKQMALGETERVEELYDLLQDLSNLMLLYAMFTDSETKLANSLKKTQVRVNALQNVVIPKQTAQIAQMTDSLQEQEREAQGRLRRV